MIIKIQGMQPIYASSLTAVTSTSATAQVIETTALAGSLITQSSWFYLFSANSTNVYAIWFDVDGGGTAPSIPGVTLLQVTIDSSDLATAVATAIQSAVTGNAAANADFTVGLIGTPVITFTNKANGAARFPVDGAIACGMMFEATTVGSIATSGLTNLYRIEGFYYVPSSYTEMNLIKERYFQKQSVNFIIHGLRITSIDETH